MKIRRFLLSLLLLLPLAVHAATGKTGNRPAQLNTACVKKPPAPRRAVPRIPAQSLPAPVAPVAPLAVPAAPAQAAPNSPAPPATIGTCDPGGCWDAGANRYNGGAGGAFLDRSGRLCQRNGVSMQCF